MLTLAFKIYIITAIFFPTQVLLFFIIIFLISHQFYTYYCNFTDKETKAEKGLIAVPKVT